MKCIAEQVIDRMRELNNDISSANEILQCALSQFSLSRIDAYSERINERVYYAFDDQSTLSIKENTGEVSYHYYIDKHQNTIEVHDFLLDASLQDAKELDEEIYNEDGFCTLDIDLEEDMKPSLVEKYLKDKLNKTNLEYLMNYGFNNGVLLYHAILNQALADKIPGSYDLDSPDDLVISYLKLHLNPASYSLFDIKYEICDQLFDIFLNEQILLILKNQVEEDKASGKNQNQSSET